MLKKVITIVLMLCLIFSISVMTVTAVGETQQGGGRGGMPPMGEMPQGEFTPSEDFTPPEGFTPPQNAGEFAPPQSEERGSAETTDPKTNKDLTEEGQQTQENGEDANQTQGGNQQFGDQMPGGMGGFSGNMQSFNGQTQENAPKGFLGFVKTYSTPITSVVLLGLAFIFVIFYRRKNY